MVCLLDASVGVGMCWLGWAAGGTLKPPPILGGEGVQLHLRKTTSEETQEENLHFHGF